MTIQPIKTQKLKEGFELMVKVCDRNDYLEKEILKLTKLIFLAIAQNAGNPLQLKREPNNQLNDDIENQSITLSIGGDGLSFWAFKNNKAVPLLESDYQKYFTL